MKVDAKNYGTHNPYEESHWVSRLRENFTSGSYGEGLETDLRAPRQSLTRQVFFKMMKHYLNLERETQLRDFDGIIGHITIVMSRYVFLAFEQRCHDDPRTLGTLFYACSEEQKDLSLAEALRRLLSLALAKAREAGIIAEDAVLALIDAVMSFAIDMLQTGKRLQLVNSQFAAS